MGAIANPSRRRARSAPFLLLLLLLSRSFSRNISVTGRERERTAWLKSRKLKPEISRARARDISGYGRARIHGRNDFSSRWKLVEKRGGLSHRKLRASALRGELRAMVPLLSFPGQGNERDEGAMSKFERINSFWM